MDLTSKQTADKVWTTARDAAAKVSARSRYGFLACGGWTLSTLLLRRVDKDGEITLYWGLLVLYGLLFFGYAYYYLMPRLISQKRGLRGYLVRIGGILLLTLIPVFFVILALTSDAEVSMSFGLFNFIFHFLLTAPLCWGLFTWQVGRTRQIAVLETELGQSNANLDFLRSQINPHFLFNALNTLYGLALQGNSERTAEGVQMLGDIMRFMLHENQQPWILLAREVEYLHNYLALQRLRTVASPHIIITATLDDGPTNQHIAPMLLIPFVENAFKHGISLEYNSWISISLHYEPNRLCLDVRNSTHTKPAQGVPRASGVGLENVQQRLALLYPDQHELVIRQTATEYFVHLTLQLERPL